MPIQSCTLPNGDSGYRWGESGKCYASRAGAERQGAAAYTNGYAGKVSLLCVLRKAAPRTQLCALLIKNVDQAAHSSATSPLNLRARPTEAQAAAGNYKKGHAKVAGLSVSVENPAGSYRRPEWPVMQAHYGYLKGTTGADGGHLDVFVRPSTPEDWDGEAYVINQVDADGAFDEHKIMLGYDDQEQAVKAYLSHYPKGWRLGEVCAMSLDELRGWLEGDTTVPLTKEWSAPSSATSGIQPYGSKPSKTRRKARLTSKETQNGN